MLASAEPVVNDVVACKSGKRVLFLTHVGAPGGAEYKMLSLCQHLPQAEVLTFSHGEFLDILARSGVPAQVCEMPDAMGQVRRENGVKSILQAIPAVLRMLRDVARHCRDYDVVVPMSQKAFIMVALSKPLHRKPVVWYMNDLLSREHFNPMLMRALTLISRFTANHIVFNSQASKQAWVKEGGRSERISICYPGSDIKMLDEALAHHAKVNAVRAEFSPDNKPLIGTVGRISPWKGAGCVLAGAGAIAADARGDCGGCAVW